METKQDVIPNIYDAAIHSKKSTGKTLLFQSSDLGTYLQTIPPNSQIDVEIHPNATQMFQILQGAGVARIGENEFRVSTGTLFYARRGQVHTVRAGPGGMKMLTTYGPAKHKVEIL